MEAMASGARASAEGERAPSPQSEQRAKGWKSMRRAVKFGSCMSKVRNLTGRLVCRTSLGAPYVDEPNFVTIEPPMRDTLVVQGNQELIIANGEISVLITDHFGRVVRTYRLAHALERGQISIATPDGALTVWLAARGEASAGIFEILSVRLLAPHLANSDTISPSPSVPATPAGGPGSPLGSPAAGGPGATCANSLALSLLPSPAELARPKRSPRKMSIVGKRRQSSLLAGGAVEGFARACSPPASRSDPHTLTR